MRVTGLILAAVAVAASTAPSTMEAIPLAHLVRDVAPGPENSYLELLGIVGNHLLFVATDAAHGRELWRSDGTAVGTELVRDIRPGPEGGVGYGGAVLFAGQLAFSASDGHGGAQLWRSDGTEAGTVLVRDAAPGIERAMVRLLTPDGPRLWFTATENFYDENLDGTEDLWTTDLTPAGTARVAARVGYWQTGFSGGAAGVSSLTPFRGGVLVARRDLFECCERTSLGLLGVDGGTGIASVYESETYGHWGYTPPLVPFVAADTAYFATRDGRGGNCRIWRTDGGGAEAIDAGDGPCAITPLAAFGSDLLLSRNDASVQLLRATPTDESLTPVADLGPGYLDAFSSVTASDGLSFILRRDDADEWWRAASASEPPVLLHRFPRRDVNPQFQLNRARDGAGALLWSSDSEGSNGVLWRGGDAESDPAPVGVMPRGAVGSGAVDSGSSVFLVGYDGEHGAELWAIDRGPVCAGDCDVSGAVHVDELVLAVDVALEIARVNACPAADSDADLAVSIAEIVAAVRAALVGCA